MLPGPKLLLGSKLGISGCLTLSDPKTHFLLKLLIAKET